MTSPDLQCSLILRFVLEEYLGPAPFPDTEA